MDTQKYLVFSLNSQGKFPAFVWAGPGNIAHAGPVFLRSLEQKILKQDLKDKENLKASKTSVWWFCIVFYGTLSMYKNLLSSYCYRNCFPLEGNPYIRFVSVKSWKLVFKNCLSCLIVKGWEISQAVFCSRQTRKDRSWYLHPWPEIWNIPIITATHLFSGYLFKCLLTLFIMVNYVKFGID